MTTKSVCEKMCSVTNDHATITSNYHYNLPVLALTGASFTRFPAPRRSPSACLMLALLETLKPSPLRSQRS